MGAEGSLGGGLRSEIRDHCKGQILEAPEVQVGVSSPEVLVLLPPMPLRPTGSAAVLCGASERRVEGWKASNIMAFS